MIRTSDSQKGRLTIVHILVIVFIGFGVWYFFTHAPEPSRTDNKLEEQHQQTADGAMDFYLNSAYRYLHDETNGNLMELQTAMPKEDWDWFEANYSSLFKQGDTLKLGNVIAADQNVALSRLVVLKSLLQAGPSQTNVKKLKKDESKPGVVVFTLRQEDGLGGSQDYAVEAVNTGKYWKVKAFDCARKNMGMVQ